jgi:hypothetical protein
MRNPKQKRGSDDDANSSQRFEKCIRLNDSSSAAGVDLHGERAK